MKNNYQYAALTLGLGLGLTLILLWLLPGQTYTAQADPGIRYVAPDGIDNGLCDSIANRCRTVQAAIDAAVSLDEIRVAAGTYTSTGGAVAAITKTVKLLGGWSSSFAARDPSAYLSTLDAGGNGRVVYVSGNISPTIDGFTIRGGNATSETISAGWGGGIYSSGASPIIQGNIIISNTASISPSNGGGIYTRFTGRPHIEGNLFINNTAGWFGGAMLYTNGSQPTVNANRILSNTSSRDTAQVILETGGYYTVTNNLIAHNDGGGIRVWDTTRYGLVAHNTIVFNSGADGGIRVAVGYITPTVLNNIVVSNSYGIGADTDATGTLDYNDVWGNTTMDYNLPGALEPGPHDIQADPLFVHPAGDDYHLQAGSPCIGAGTDAGVTTDIDGDARPIGVGYDIGADEARQLDVYLPLVIRQWP